MGSKRFAHFEDKSFGRKMAMGSIPTYLQCNYAFSHQDYSREKAQKHQF